MRFAAVLFPPLSLFAAFIATAAGADWPTWRGPGGFGVAVSANVPTHWTRTENVRWRVDLPEPGNSTPIVWKDRIFLTQAVEKENRRTLMCFDRATGKLLWQSGVTYEAEDPTHRTNPHASASPVTDGTYVYVWFGSAGVLAYDFDGREVWRRDLGKQTHVWGYGSSPLVHGGRLFLTFGPGEPSFLIALDAKTGETLWRYDYRAVKSGALLEQAGRDGRGPKPGEPGNSGAGAADYYGTWGTPIVIDTGKREELIVHLPLRVAAFDPQTGKELWTCRGLSDLVYTSPMWGEGLVVSFGSFQGASLAVRPGGDGDVTETHRLWHKPRSRLRLGTGVIANGHIYIADLGGIAECMELKTGKTIWRNRLRGGAEKDATWSSITRNGDRLFLLNQAGDTFVFLARPEFELLRRNSLGEFTNSSVVIAGDEIFIRTYESLWSISSLP